MIDFNRVQDLEKRHIDGRRALWNRLVEIVLRLLLEKGTVPNLGNLSLLLNDSIISLWHLILILLGCSYVLTIGSLIEGALLLRHVMDRGRNPMKLDFPLGGRLPEGGLRSLGIAWLIIPILSLNGPMTASMV